MILLKRLLLLSIYIVITEQCLRLFYPDYGYGPYGLAPPPPDYGYGGYGGGIVQDATNHGARSPNIVSNILSSLGLKMVLLKLLLLLSIYVGTTEQCLRYLYPDYGYGPYGPAPPPPDYGYGGYGGYARAPGLVSNILYSLGLKKK